MEKYKAANPRKKKKAKQSPKKIVVQQKTQRQLYHEYLNSEDWKERRDKFREYYGNKCIFCKSETNLNMHHLHYDNIGNETTNDVVCLCRDCHALVHDNMLSIIAFDTKEDVEHFIAIAPTLVKSIHPIRNYIIFEKEQLVNQK